MIRAKLKSGKAELPRLVDKTSYLGFCLFTNSYDLRHKGKAV